MTRFSARSSSGIPAASTSIKANARVAALALMPEGQVQAGRSKLGKMLHKGGKSKSRGGLSSSDKDRAKAVIKREQTKQSIALPQWSYVFVGNLNPSINEVDLEKAFRHCGKITSILIRVSSGHVAIVAPEDYKYSPADRQYASVQFTEPAAARRAKRMNGQEINGRRIVVCYNAIDLPETKDTIQAYLAESEPDKDIDWKDYYTAFKQITATRSTQAAVHPSPSEPVGSLAPQLKMPQAVGKKFTFPRTVM